MKRFEHIVGALLMAALAAATSAVTAAQTRVAARDGDVPVIKAEPGPVKIKPDDPGGLKVPHRDKTIYERIQSRHSLGKNGQGPEKYRIQIGSFGDTQSAAKQWQGLRRTHRDVLGQLQMHIEKVALENGRKTVYRLQAGPFESAAEVKKICSALAERKVGCLLVKI